MSTSLNPPRSTALSRRGFLKSSGAAVVTSAIAAHEFMPSNVHAAGGDVLRVGLIGCGGRGTGAAAQALKADPNVKLMALGDVFKDRVNFAAKAEKK